MAQSILRSNHRVAWAFLGLVVVLVALALSLIFGVRSLTGESSAGNARVLHWVGVGLAVLLLVPALWLTTFAGQSLLRPRLALTADALRVYLRGWQCYEVPLQAVECFFIGQHDAGLKGRTRRGAKMESVTVVVRLAERAQQWQSRPVNPLLGRWHNGYITLFGLWCEPLDGEVVTRMNHELAKAKRAQKENSPRSSSVFGNR